MAFHAELLGSWLRRLGGSRGAALQSAHWLRPGLLCVRGNQWGGQPRLGATEAEFTGHEWSQIETKGAVLGKLNRSKDGHRRPPRPPFLPDHRLRLQPPLLLRQHPRRRPCLQRQLGLRRRVHVEGHEPAADFELAAGERVRLHHAEPQHQRDELGEGHREDIEGQDTRHKEERRRQLGDPIRQLTELLDANSVEQLRIREDK